MTFALQDTLADRLELIAREGAYLTPENRIALVQIADRVRELEGERVARRRSLRRLWRFVFAKNADAGAAEIPPIWR
jgi:hypothetical protein